MAEENGKKKRAKRRNYATEMQRLQQYCEIKQDVLMSIVANDDGDTRINGQIDAYGDVLSRIKGTL